MFAYGITQYLKPGWLTDDQGHNITIFGYGAVAVMGIGALGLGLILMTIRRVVSLGFSMGSHSGGEAGIRTVWSRIEVEATR